MTPKGKRNTIIAVSLLAIGGAVTFLLYKKKKGPFKVKDPVLPQLPQTDSSPQIVYVDSPSGGGSGGGSTGSDKPGNILDFQQWVINTKKDKTILGGGGSTGFGDDGKWGGKTQGAWAKYKEEYATDGDLAKNRVAFSKVQKWAKGKGMETFWYTRMKVDGDTFLDGKKRHYVTATGKLYVKPNTPLTGEGMIGQTVYPKSGSYANLRDNSHVDNSGGDNTFIGQINSPNAIGKVTNFTLGSTDGKRWYYIKTFTTPLMESTHGLWYANTDQKGGWVREDSIKPIMSK